MQLLAGGMPDALLLLGRKWQACTDLGLHGEAAPSTEQIQKMVWLVR